jgi:hypothetical protein
MIVGFRFLVVFFFRVQPPLAWTLTCVVHAIVRLSPEPITLILLLTISYMIRQCTFMSFHWNKGLPYLDTSMQQGEVAGLTAWEQWSRYPVSC